MPHVIGLALIAVGTAVAVVATATAVAARDVFDRLHLVTPLTSLSAPLVAAGVCVQSGQPWVIAEVLVIVMLLFVSGPVLESATGRVAAQRAGRVSEEQPP